MNELLLFTDNYKSDQFCLPFVVYTSTVLPHKRYTHILLCVCAHVCTHACMHVPVSACEREREREGEREREREREGKNDFGLNIGYFLHSLCTIRTQTLYVTTFFKVIQKKMHIMLFTLLRAHSIDIFIHTNALCSDN